MLRKNRKYCPSCGSTLKIVKRIPVFNVDSGELEGYHVNIACNRGGIFNVMIRHGIWWDYEDLV